MELYRVIVEGGIVMSYTRRDEAISIYRCVVDKMPHRWCYVDYTRITDSGKIWMVIESHPEV